MRGAGVFGPGVGSVLFVHAHPDDETLATGGTVARLVDEGVGVGVLTATRGERGDIVPGSLGELPATELTTVRRAERAAALGALGVDDYWWLGEPPARAEGLAPREYSDSGMQWGEDGFAAPAADVSPLALTSAPLSEARDDLLALVRATRPDLLVGYESTGGYGHPDHVRVHELVRSAAATAGIRFAQVVPPALVADGDLGVDVSRQQGRVLAALGCYRTQLEQVHADHVVHVGGQRQELPTVEYFRFGPESAGPTGPVGGGTVR